jgi:prolipoprotein diacylglyceryltransferase
MWLLSPHPILFHTGLATIYTHGVFFALAAVCSVLAMQLLAVSKGLPADDVPLYGVIIFLSGLIAARIGFFVSYPSAFASLADVVAIWRGGLVSYWAIGGGLAAGYLLFKRVGGVMASWMDVTCLSGLLGWSIGRLGNYYAGDSVGVLNGHFAPFYGRVPIQLFEAAWCLMLFFALKGRVASLPPGLSALYGLTGYFAGRIVIDGWRDEGYLIGAVHTSQVISIVSLATLVFMLWRHKASHE